MKIRKLAPNEFRKWPEEKRVDFIRSILRRYPEASCKDIYRLCACDPSIIYNITKKHDLKMKNYRGSSSENRDVWDLYIKFFDGKFERFNGQILDLNQITQDLEEGKIISWETFQSVPNRLKAEFFKKLNKPVARVAEMFGVDYSSVYTIAIDYLGLRWMANIKSTDPESDSEGGNDSHQSTGTGTQRASGPAKLGDAEISIYADGVEAIIRALGIVNLVSRDQVIGIRVEADPDTTSTRKTFIRDCKCNIMNGTAEAFLRELRLYGRTRVTFYIP